MADMLNGCVSSLRSSMQLLDSSITILDSGVSDFPRLTKVLSTTRHFELIAEPDLHAAQAALHSEIRPEVDGLLSRVEKYLERLERREQSLIAEAELQEGRLADSHTNTNTNANNEGEDGRGGKGRLGGVARPLSRKSLVPGAGGLEALKVQQMRQKKERLSFAIDRLALQSKQMERRLRMSVAPAGNDLD